MNEYFPFSENKILIFMEKMLKKNREIDLFDFSSFFWPGHFKIFWPAMKKKIIFSCNINFMKFREISCNY